MIIRHKRCCTIPRTFLSTGDEVWHDTWHDDATFHTIESTIVQRVTQELQTVVTEA